MPVSHLRRRDRVLRGVIDAVGPLDITKWTSLRPKDPYGSLLRSIIGQQLSVSAASSIFGRLKEASGGRSPTPEHLLRMRSTTLRACGLSGAKVDYVRDLARHVLSGELDLPRLRRLEDEEVREAITAVRGLGRWTADMFLMFHLQRPDVLPVGDLGLRRAVQRAYAIDEPKPAELQRIAEPWRPYRSMASLYLWSSLSLPR
ncbi:MAG: DNA-3-methyladenine glycosylase 2 family protein [Chloroflexi bacterium]|nr:DNA-3-methyladenine glycosylase 2 family protein [Chloroflexota bacterium]